MVRGQGSDVRGGWRRMEDWEGQVFWAPWGGNDQLRTRWGAGKARQNRTSLGLFVSPGQ